MEEIWGPGGLTEQIRAGWSLAEFNRRLVCKTEDVRVPVVPDPEID